MSVAAKTMLVPRSSWPGCQKCWREGVPHNGKDAIFGGPCYIRFGYCDHVEIGTGMRLRPPKGFTKVGKDKAGRWVWRR